MSAQYDPYATFLLDSLLKGTQSALTGIGAGLQQNTQRSLAENAIREYTENPTMENMLKLSQYVNVNSVMQAAAAEQATREAVQSQKGIEQLSELLASPDQAAQLSPEILQAFAAYPQLINLLKGSAQEGPLSHLHEQEK